MNIEQIEIKVIEIISIILKADIESKNSRQDYENWDSLKHLEILFAIEDEFQINFPEHIIEKLNSADEISKEVQVLINET